MATKVLPEKTAFMERGVQADLSRGPCKRMDNPNLWILERIMELPDGEGEESFFGVGCPADRLTLRPHQQTPAGL